MKIRATAAAALLTLALAVPLAACSSTSTAGTAGAGAPSASQTASMDHDMSTASANAATRTGSFSGLNGKSVAGTATLNGTTLTLSGFSSDEGPDLHVYLTKGTDEAAVAAGKSLGAVSFSSGDQTFALSGVDASMYTDVVIHCDKAKAVFGAAALS